MMTGEELKAERKKSGLTQKKLGLLCGYEEKSAERVIQLWEHDKQPIPSERFRALAKALNVPLDKVVP